VLVERLAAQDAAKFEGEPLLPDVRPPEFDPPCTNQIFNLPGRLSSLPSPTSASRRFEEIWTAYC
jgi:hypothetical protein